MGSLSCKRKLSRDGYFYFYFYFTSFHAAQAQAHILYLRTSLMERRGIQPIGREKPYRFSLWDK